MTLHRKILAGFVLCTLLLLVVGAISFRNSEKFVDTNRLVSHTHEVLYELGQVLVNVVDAETGERGYIITGDENYLEPYEHAKAQLSEHLKKVRELTKDNPSQQKNIEAIEEQAGIIIVRLQACIAARKTGGFEAARDMVLSGTGKAAVDKMRRLIDDANAVEQQLLIDRQKVNGDDTRNFNLIFIALLSIMLLVLAIVFFIITVNLKALKKAEKETADKNWSLAGSEELVKSMQGNKQLEELAQTIISHLATLLNAQCGAIYVTSEDNLHLEMIGTFAMDKRKMDFPVTPFGEGLAGQSAAERRNILVTGITDGHFSVSTGFGHLVPENILVVPFIFEGNVAGVIELGSVREFTTLQQEYLRTATDNIGIAIASSMAREKAGELLEETQRQAEELVVQQEELRQTNEELHAKTELLERSDWELKAQQEKLLQTNEALEEKALMLEEQKKELEKAKKEVEAKAGELELTGKYKSEFLANMSHELRTPLNSVLILAQLLSENKTGALKEKEVEYARNIYNSGTDLLNLINEILDLAKVEAGKVELEITDVTLRTVSGSLSATFDEMANKNDIDFRLHYPEGTPDIPFYTDRQRLEQILRNLISNAVKFTGKGGKVTVGMDIKDEVVSFSVTDTGIGIPANKQEIIFKAFEQADGSTKRKYGGTGLGLSISRELAHALGGEIYLQSEEGRGSCFTLYLPLKFDPQAVLPAIEIEKKASAPEKVPVRQEEQGNLPALPGSAPDDRYAIQENDRTVLVVEDDEHFAGILLDFLRERNYKVIVAHQGNSGLSLARYYRPDLIVLDMQLPVMDGFEVLRRLKNDPDLRHIPVQMISGHDRKKESLELGAFDFIRKPVTMAAIAEALDKMEDFIRRKLKKLLVVEDNKEQNTAIRELIGNGDVKSFSAYAGGEAYEMMKKERFDCIIIDLGLPDMSGMDLLEKIRGSAEFSRIPIVVYTGKDLDKKESARLSQLADTVVLKTADSRERLLDETILFLHRAESKLSRDRQQIIRKLHRTDDALKEKKVMVVDDDMRNIYSLTNALEEEGVVCITAENGKEAIILLQQHPDTDIVLMDVMMPEMDGYEATHEIRKMKEFGKLPVIALTAKAMKGDREKCMAAGMSDYITKPVNIEQLFSLMRVWL